MKMMDSDYRFKYYICRQASHKQTMSLPQFNPERIWEGLGGAIPIELDAQMWLPSFYDWPAYMMNDKLNQIVSRFCENMEKKPVAIVDAAAGFSQLYWICRFRQFECKNPMARLAVPLICVKGENIFQLKKGMKIYLILTASLAEEILKAGLADIELEGVCVDE